MTTNPFDAARELLADFRTRGLTPYLWLLSPHARNEMRAQAEAAQAFGTARDGVPITLLGVTYITSAKSGGIELLTRAEAVARGHAL